MTDQLFELIENIVSYDKANDEELGRCVRELATIQGNDLSSLDSEKKKKLRVLITKIIGTTKIDRKTKFAALTSVVSKDVLDVLENTKLYAWFFEQFKTMIAEQRDPAESTTFIQCINIITMMMMIENDNEIGDFAINDLSCLLEDSKCSKEKLKSFELCKQACEDCFNTSFWLKLDPEIKTKILGIYVRTMYLAKSSIAYRNQPIPLLSALMSNDATSQLALEASFMLLTLLTKMDHGRSKVISEFFENFPIVPACTSEKGISLLESFVKIVHGTVRETELCTREFLSFLLSLMKLSNSDSTLLTIIDIMIMLSLRNSQFENLVLNDYFVEEIVPKLTKTTISKQIFDRFSQSFMNESIDRLNPKFLAALLANHEFLSDNLFVQATAHIELFNSRKWTLQFRHTVSIIEILCELLTSSRIHLIPSQIFDVLRKQLLYSCSTHEFNSIIRVFKKLKARDSGWEIVMLILDAIIFAVMHSNADRKSISHELGFYRDDSTMMIGACQTKSEVNPLSIYIRFSIESDERHSTRSFIFVQTRSLDQICVMLNLRTKLLKILCRTGGNHHETQLPIDSKNHYHQLLIVYTYRIGLLKTISQLYCRLDDSRETIVWQGSAILNIQHGLKKFTIGPNDSTYNFCGSVLEVILSAKSWVDIWKAENLNNVSIPPDSDTQCFLHLTGKSHDGAGVHDLSGKENLVKINSIVRFSRTHIALSISTLGGYKVFYPLVIGLEKYSNSVKYLSKLVRFINDLNFSNLFALHANDHFAFCGLILEMSKYPFCAEFANSVQAFTQSITKCITHLPLYWKDLLFLFHSTNPFWKNANLDQHIDRLTYLKKLLPDLYNNPHAVNALTFQECLQFIDQCLCLPKDGNELRLSIFFNIRTRILTDICKFGLYNAHSEFVPFLIDVNGDDNLFDCAIKASIEQIEICNDQKIIEAFAGDMTSILTKVYVEHLGKMATFADTLKLISACLTRAYRGSDAHRTISSEYIQTYLSALRGKSLSLESIKSISQIVINYLKNVVHYDQTDISILSIFFVLISEIGLDARISLLTKVVVELTFSRPDFNKAFISDQLSKHAFVPLLYNTQQAILNSEQMVHLQDFQMKRSLSFKEFSFSDQVDKSDSDLQNSWFLLLSCLLHSFIYGQPTLSDSGRQWNAIRGIVAELRFFDKLLDVHQSTHVIERMVLQLLNLLSSSEFKSDPKLKAEYTANILDLIATDVFEERISAKFVRDFAEKLFNEEMKMPMFELFSQEQRSQTRLILILLLTKLNKVEGNNEKIEEVLMLLASSLNDVELSIILKSIENKRSRAIYGILLGKLTKKYPSVEQNASIIDIDDYFGSNFIERSCAEFKRNCELDEQVISRCCDRTRFQFNNRLSSLADAFKKERMYYRDHKDRMDCALEKKQKSLSSRQSQMKIANTVFPSIVADQARWYWQIGEVIDSARSTERVAVVNGESGCHLRCRLRRIKKAVLDRQTGCTDYGNRSRSLSNYPHFLKDDGNHDRKNIETTRESFDLLEEENAGSSTEDNRSAVYFCSHITIGTETLGTITLSENQIIFSGPSPDPTTAAITFALSRIMYIFPRRYKLTYSAIEFYLTNQQSYYFNLADFNSRNDLMQRIYRMRPSNLVKASMLSPRDAVKSFDLTNRWVNGEMSNFDYLMFLNLVSGRSFNTLSQYPVFPWILSDYHSETLDLDNPKVYRDLSKPVGAQTDQQIESASKRLEHNMDSSQETFHYGTHYSSPAIVIHYLIRLEPFTRLHINLQGGKIDYANRLFHSVQASWNSIQSISSDVMELIPEFFYLSCMFKNPNKLELGRLPSSKSVCEVELPPWASKDPEQVAFSRRNIEHRQALESPVVGGQLHKWIDLIFGYKQRGNAAVQSLNLFMPNCYFGDRESIRKAESIVDTVQRRELELLITEFGQVPRQIFKQPHPRRIRFEDKDGFCYETAQAFLLNGEGNHLRCGSILLLLGNLQARSVSFGILADKMDGSLLSLNRVGDVCVHTWASGGSGLCLNKAVSISLKSFSDLSLRFVVSVALLSSDSKRLCCGAFTDNSIRVYSTVTGRICERVLAHFDSVGAIAVDELADRLVSGSRDSQVLIWSFCVAKFTFNSSSPIRAINGHYEAIAALDVSAQHGAIVSASQTRIMMHEANDDGRCFANRGEFNGIHQIKFTEGPYVLVVQKPREFSNTLSLLSANSLSQAKERLVMGCVDQISIGKDDRFAMITRSTSRRVHLFICSLRKLETLHCIDLKLADVQSACSFWHTPRFSNIFCLATNNQSQTVLVTMTNKTRSRDDDDNNRTQSAAVMRSSRKLLKSLHDTMSDFRRSLQTD